MAERNNSNDAATENARAGEGTSGTCNANRQGNDGNSRRMNRVVRVRNAQNVRPNPRQQQALENYMQELNINEHRNRGSLSQEPGSPTTPPDNQFYFLSQNTGNPKKRKYTRSISPWRLEYVRRKSRELRASLEACGSDDSD